MLFRSLKSLHKKHVFRTFWGLSGGGRSRFYKRLCTRVSDFELQSSELGCRSFSNTKKRSFSNTKIRSFSNTKKRSFFNTTPKNQRLNSHRRQDSAQRSRKKKGCWLFWDSYTHLGAHTIFYIYMLFIFCMDIWNNA